MKHPHTLAILFVLVGCSLVHGANLPSDRPLTLQDCISYALENHNSVLAAQRELAASTAETRQAKAGYLPNMTVSSRHIRSDSEEGDLLSKDGIGTGTELTRKGASTEDEVTLGISPTIYDGGRIRMAIRQAVASEKASEAEVELARQDRILAVTQAYFQSLLTKRLADIAAQSVAEAQKQYDMVRTRIEAGDAAKVDIYPVEVQLANSRLKKLQADNDARIAANILRNAMGLGRGPELKLVDIDEPASEPLPSLEDCLSYAMDHRPEVARVMAQLESAQAALSYAKSQAGPIPTVTLGYEEGLSGSNSGSGWAIELGLSMKIFDGGATKAEIDSSKARLESLRYTAEQLRQDIATQVEEAHLNLSNALERLVASKANVELAKTNLEVASSKYEQGLAIPLEVVSAQVSYADAQANYAQALYDSYLARAELDKAMGKRRN